MNESAMLRLNRESEKETSPLDKTSLRAFISKSFHVGLRNDGESAFLIALVESAAYENINFLWFKSRYPKFVYVDRIVVAQNQRNRGLARGLNAELFEIALTSGREAIVCEVNLSPPNPGSIAFHRYLGFEQVGEVTLKPGKQVAYFRKELRLAPSN